MTKVLKEKEDFKKQEQDGTTLYPAGNYISKSIKIRN